jgi:predicted pyridoxine 5'-phosphate oxidase superfamily flavin-nucleotide-binding protein
MPGSNGPDAPMYHEGMRVLQDASGTRRLADRLQQLTLHAAFSDEDRAFIEAAPMFFLATADPRGQPDCSYKGGLPGFVRVVAPDTLAFPDYDGNGMFRSLGNVLANPAVGMLFIDFASPKRLRVNGQASVSAEDALLPEFEGAQRIVRVQATRIFPNCPRYIHRMQLVEPSPYAPRAGHVPPVPNWKRWDALQDVLPPEP